MPVIPWEVKTLLVLVLLAAAGYGGYQHADQKWQTRWNEAKADAEGEARDTEAAGNAMAARIEANTLALMGQIEADARKTEQLVTTYGNESAEREAASSCNREGAPGGRGPGPEAGRGSRPAQDDGEAGIQSPAGRTRLVGSWASAQWVLAFNTSVGTPEAPAPAPGGNGEVVPGAPMSDALRAATSNNLLAREAVGKLRQCREYVRGLCKEYGCQGGENGG